MRDIYLGAPSAKQRFFLQDTHRIVIYGGARGGGKSWAVRSKAVIMAFAYAGIRQLIVRRTYPELINNHINPLKVTLAGIAKYNGTEKTFTFTNGSALNFMYCARDDHLQHLQGTEYDIIYIDEATQLTEHQIKVIYSCVRGANEFPKRLYMTCNPGGQGHGYIKRIAIDRRFVDGEDPEDYVFIPARVDDNDALMRTQPEYKKNLEMLPEKLRKAWLEGSFDIFEGQFFEEFVVGDEVQQHDRQWTHVIEPFPIPREWEVYRSYDFGYSRPFSCGWWAVDYAGTYYRILELYGCTGVPNEGVKWPADEQFRKIREIETQHPLLAGRTIRGVADPSIWDGSKGDSVNDTAMRHQVYFTKGDNHRIAGWMQVRYRLQFNEHGEPRMYIFNTCKDFIRTFPTLLYSETNPEDLDTDGEDHIADETRYMCMQHQIRSREPLPDSQQQIAFDPLNQKQTARNSMIRRV